MMCPSLRSEEIGWIGRGEAGMQALAMTVCITLYFLEVLNDGGDGGMEGVWVENEISKDGIVEDTDI